jgi:hypothetical protein
MNLPARLLSPLVLLIASPAWAQDDPAAQASYSRDLLLPLVSKPGKEKNLFVSVTPEENCVWNSKFWGASLGFDQFSGVGWNSDRAGVLVTPQHILAAKHYPLKPGRPVSFYGKDGRFLGTRKVAPAAEGSPSNIKLANDVMVAKLERPAPAGARIYPLPDPATHEARKAWGLLPKPQLPLLIATDWKNPSPPNPDGSPAKKKWVVTRSAHVARLAPSRGDILQWTYGATGEPAVHPSYHETVNFGDSSHPLFWVSKSGLVLASTFSGTNSGPDYGSPVVQAAIQRAIDAMRGEDDYTLKTVPVP